jgi:hypothetical protein
MAMTTTELLMLLQTVIMLITGVALIYYTVETRRLRTVATAQTQVMQRTLGLQLQEAKLAAQPIIVWGHGSNNNDVVEWAFLNEGGPISHLTIRIPSPTGAQTGIHAAIGPTEWLGTSREGRVTLRGNTAGEIRFSIGFQTRLGGVGAHFFFIPSRGAAPVFTGSGEL